jgi:hypothetical protein
MNKNQSVFWPTAIVFLLIIMLISAASFIRFSYLAAVAQAPAAPAGTTLAYTTQYVCRGKIEISEASGVWSELVVPCAKSLDGFIYNGSKYKVEVRVLSDSGKLVYGPFQLIKGGGMKVPER